MADGLAWMQDVVLGTVGTTTAVIAVASVGLFMLSGRLELRRGITVVAGCFLLFGAGSIASTLTGLTAHSAPPPRPMATESVSLPDHLRDRPAPTAYDPYAGASVPVPRQ